LNPNTEMSAKEVDALFTLICTSNLFLTGIYLTVASKAEDPMLYLLVAVCYSTLDLLVITGWMYACFRQKLVAKIVSWTVGIFVTISLYAGLLVTWWIAPWYPADYRPTLGLAMSLSLVIAVTATTKFVTPVYQGIYGRSRKIDKLCRIMFLGAIITFLVVFVNSVLPWLFKLLLMSDP